GWVNKETLLNHNERLELAANIRPIRLLLVKLQKLATKIVHSTTILLPVWKGILEDLKLAQQIMPRDVSTRWNSTFDMLNFALEYRNAIDVIVDKQKLGLGEYVLEDGEWMLVKQLHDVLKVCGHMTLSKSNYLVVLHPQHKLSYFRSAGWQQDWIDTAENLVCTEFKCYVSHL
ncbi:uncharacterized protein F5147DRAFT_528837, partial [Suillus discolor]